MTRCDIDHRAQTCLQPGNTSALSASADLGSASGDDSPGDCKARLRTLPERLAVGDPSVELPGLHVCEECTVQLKACSGLTTCPASGEAVITVPGVGSGGGNGDSGLKSGWMCD